MEFSVKFENAPGLPENKGPVTVGWFLNSQKAGVIFYPPERFRSTEKNKTHAKSASRCPAVINMESRYFVFRAPFDLHLQFVRDKDGKPGLRNLNGDLSPVRANKISQHLHVTSEKEWRHPNVPTIQLSLPYVLVADEPVYATQLAPFMHYQKDPWPGTIFGGRFPINVWPRPLMWAFEWHDTTKPLKINRGDPLFYVMFEAATPDRSVALVETELTKDLADYVDFVSGAVNFVNQTFSLFERAEEVRPDTLIKPLKRRKTDD